MMSKMGCGFLRAHIEDFPAVVIAEAAAELQSQMGAYGILRESAQAAASGARSSMPRPRLPSWPATSRWT